MKSYEKPTTSEIDAAVALLGPLANQQYFFDRLNNPLWIGPLHERGVFRHPLEPTRDGSVVRSTPWPASRYLSRMAGLVPGEVADIFASLKTANWTIARDVLEAATSMPPKYAAKLVPKLIELTTGSFFSHDIRELAVLCTKLASENQPDAAVELLRHVLHFEGDENQRRSDQDSRWIIDSVSKDALTAVIAARPTEVIRHLVSEVHRAIQSSKYPPSGEDDYSWIWRPAIEDHEQNDDFDVRSNLVGCLSAAAESAIRGGRLTLHDVLAIIAKPEMLVQGRLRLHLLRLFGEQSPQLVHEAVMNRFYFEKHGFKHEYALLVRKTFSSLSQEQQLKWLEWVDQGPEGVRADYFGPDENEEHRQRHRNMWRFYRLLWIENDLSGDRRRFVDSMKSSMKEEELAYFNSYHHEGFVGDASPTSLAELAKRPFAEVVEEVSAWRQPEGATRFDGPSYRGLAEQFRAYCAESAEQVSGQALLLRSRPAIYVRRFIEAMTEALKSGKTIKLGSVLDLCQWTLQQPVAVNTSPRDADPVADDQDWQYTWDAVADFLRQACESNAPIELREAAWKTIEPLFRGRIGSYMVLRSEDENPWDRDFMSYAINSAQGKAMEAVVAYSRWVAKNDATLSQSQSPDSRTWASLSEVRSLIERVLSHDKGIDGPATRAIIGAHIGFVNWIDRKWLESRAKDIFCIASPEKDVQLLGIAAWNSYLLWTHPHFGTYSLLRDEFAVGVRAAEQATECASRSYYSPLQHLGEHLITLYGRGQLNTELDRPILAQLLTKAAPRIRSHAISFVGQLLHNRDEAEQIPREVIERFEKLWEGYWPKTGKIDAQADPSSSVFSYWFISGVFDKVWSLDQLYSFVSVVRKPHADTQIMERLAAIAPTNPEKAAKILQLMVEGADEGWRIYAWRDQAKIILRTALDTRKSRDFAERTIQSLGKKGFHEFGALLN